MPPLIRLYLSQSVLGFVIAALFVAGLLWFDVGRLWYLATHTDKGPFAVLLLWAHMGFIFAAVQFGIAVMRMADRPQDDDDGSGGHRLGRPHQPYGSRIPEDLYLQVGAR